MKIKRAFTLVELLVVLSVISMLASIVMVRISLAQAGARDTTRTQQVKQIDLAVKLYSEDKGYAPKLSGLIDENGSPANTLCDIQSTEPGQVEASACFAVSTADVDSPQGRAWTALKNELSSYIKIPDDPCSGCNSGSMGFPYLGYTYVSPRALQFYCNTNNGIGLGCPAKNSSYQLYAPMERQTVPYGNDGSSNRYATASLLTLTINTGGVSVSVADNRGSNYLNCESSTCNYSVPKNAYITLTVVSLVPGTVSWGSPCFGSGLSCSFTINNNTTTSVAIVQTPLPGPDTTPPSVPQNVVVSLVGQEPDLEIQITWNPSSDSGSGVAGYKIPENGETSSGNYDENGVFVPTAPIPGTIRNTYIPTWAYGSDRCYSVIAYDLANNASAPSDYSCVAIPPNYSIDVPSDLSADTNSYPNITFFWTEGEFIHPDLHSSLVFDLYKQGSLTPVTISGGTNSYSDPLTGRRYANINDTSGFWGNEPCFTVVTRAVNPTTGASIVTSPSSSYCATYTPPPPAPFVSVPSNLSHTVAGNGRVTLYWTNSVSTYPASSIVLYELSTYKDGVYAFLGDDSNGTPSASFHPNAWGNPNPPQFCWAIRARDSGNNLSAMSAPSCFAYP